MASRDWQLQSSLAALVFQVDGGGGDLQRVLPEPQRSADGREGEGRGESRPQGPQTARRRDARIQACQAPQTWPGRETSSRPSHLSSPEPLSWQSRGPLKNWTSCNMNWCFASRGSQTVHSPNPSSFHVFDIVRPCRTKTMGTAMPLTGFGVLARTCSFAIAVLLLDDTPGRCRRLLSMGRSSHAAKTQNTRRGEYIARKAHQKSARHDKLGQLLLTCSKRSDNF